MKQPQNPSESEALIQRIRTEVQARKGLPAGALSPVADAPASGKKNTPFLQRATEALDRIKAKGEAVRKWPKFLRSLRLNQPAVNEGVVHALRSLVKEAQQIEEMVALFQARLLVLSNKQAELLQKQAELSNREAELSHKQERGFELLTVKAASAENTLNMIEEAFRIQCAPSPASEPKESAPSTLEKQLDEARVDAFYLDFENQFRGSRELIKERLLFYIPLLASVKERIPNATAVDAGCGRGEWLEVLNENGIPACGVDMSARMTRHCQSLGLQAECGDAIAYLQSLPSDSQAVISGFHIVEHLPFPVLLNLFRQSFRVLRPGGIAIFETPNPECLRVSTYTFYLDPTHRNPIPPDLLAFVGTHVGFSDAKIERLHPYCEEGVLKGYGDYAGVYVK